MVIEESLAERFGLPQETTEICTMSGIGGHIECFKSHILHMKIGTSYGEVINMKIQTKTVVTNGFSSVNLSPVDIEILKENNVCLANSKLRRESQTPNVLVGLDYYHELVTGLSHLMKTPSGLHIAKTVFGAAIYGKGAVHTGNKTDTLLCYGLTAVHESIEQDTILNSRPLTKCDTDVITKLLPLSIDLLQGNIRYSNPNGSALHERT
ncbi:hypothetical protein RB195_006798 [Necator americanus]|uniref:Uncharacterized protein n=1 Tax=Necator americanus TaxID=51031 RepID=A0ABR1BX44_NECAM